MAVKPVYVPKRIVNSLNETSARIGLGIDQVVLAAVWAFNRQSPKTKQMVIQDFWYNGVDEPKDSMETKTLKGSNALGGCIHAMGSYLCAAFRKLVAQ